MKDIGKILLLVCLIGLGHSLVKAGNPSSTNAKLPRFANDVGASSIVNPLPATISVPQDLAVQLSSYGNNLVDSVTITWAINMVIQDSIVYRTPLAPGSASGIITLDTITPYAGDFIQVWTSLPNGVSDADASNDSTSLIVCIPLAGNYTINSNAVASPTNFVSFNDAVNELLACGVSGPVRFDVVAGSGPYNEQVLITEVPGASATNTVSFVGHGSLLNYDTTTSAPYVFGLQNADWVVLDSLIIVPLSDDIYSGIMLVEQSDNNIVRNCTIDNRNVSSIGGIFIGSDFNGAFNGPATTGNNFIEHNTILGGSTGISINYYLSANNVIRDNTILNPSSYGIQVSNRSAADIIGNDISRPSRYDIDDMVGIRLYNCTGVTVENNRIHTNLVSIIDNTTGFVGIALDYCDGTQAEPNRVINNLIYDIRGQGTLYGLYNYSSDYSYFAHNTVVFDDQITLSGGIAYGLFSNEYNSIVSDSLVYNNNIVSITRASTADNYGIYIQRSVTSARADQNVYYINGNGTNYIGGWNGNDYDTLANWQTIPQGGYFDPRSVTVAPQFVSASIGNFTPTAAGIDNIMSNVGVSKDFYGVTRSAQVDPGAIEFDTSQVDIGLAAIISPEIPVTAGTPADITVSLTNQGVQNITTANVFVNINDGATDTTIGPYVYSGNLAPYAFDTVTVASFDFAGFIAPTITVWTTSPNGQQPDDQTANDTLSKDICLTLAGNYTINANLPTGGTNFRSFTDAFAALQCGVSADIVFTVAYGSGPYVGQNILFNIPGAGPGATITFDGQNADSTLLTFDGVGGVGYATILLFEADYCTFTNLTIEATGSYGFGVLLTHRADHNSFINNIFINKDSGYQLAGILAAGSVTSTNAYGNNADDLLISGNTFINGEYGVRLNGQNPMLYINAVVENNVFENQENAGINISYGRDLIVRGNQINTFRYNTSSGIVLKYLKGYNELTSNLVNCSYNGAIVRYETPLATADTCLIANNMLSSAMQSGLTIEKSINLKLYHNTLKGTSGFLEHYIDSGSIDIRNNIFLGLSGSAYIATDSLNYSAFDHNIFYSATAWVLASLYGNDLAQLQDLQTYLPQFNVNSYEGLPEFVSPTDLHLIGMLGNDQGDNTVGITTDIDGDPRPLSPSTTVDIGADEYEPLINNVAVTDILISDQPTCGQTSDYIQVVIYNSGTATQTNIPVEVAFTRGINNTLSGNVAGPLAFGAQDTITLGPINTITNNHHVTLTAYTALPGDTYPADDTLQIEHSFTPTPTPTYSTSGGCTNESQLVNITNGPFYTTEWFDAPSGNSLGTGDTFNTPNLAQNQTFYVETYNTHTDYAGLNDTSHSSSLGRSTSNGLRFEVFDRVTIDSVTIYPDTSTGYITVKIYDSSNNLVFSGPNVRLGNWNINQTAPFRVPVGADLQPGQYFMGLSSTGAYWEITRAYVPGTFPIVSNNGLISILSGSTGKFTSGITTSYYYYFFNWVYSYKGCSSGFVPVDVEVSKPVADAGNDTTICEGELASIHAYNGVQWQWSNGAQNQTQTLSPASTTTYSLTVVDQYGCISTPDDITVFVNQKPTVSFSLPDSACYDDDPIALNPSPAGGTFTGPAISGSTFDPGNAGIGDNHITYSYTDGNGCSNQLTKTVNIGLSNCYSGIGTTQSDFAEAIRVYPNPFSDHINIDFVAGAEGVVTVNILDILGQQVYTTELTTHTGANSFAMDADGNLLNGFYIVELKQGDQSVQFKMLKAE